MTPEQLVRFAVEPMAMSSDDGDAVRRATEATHARVQAIHDKGGAVGLLEVAHALAGLLGAAISDRAADAGVPVEQMLDVYCPADEE